MTHSEKNPKWTQLPNGGATCRICGEPIYLDEEYEVVKPKSPRPTMYFHAACIEKERAKRCITTPKTTTG